MEREDVKDFTVAENVERFSRREKPFSVVGVREKEDL